MLPRLPPPESLSSPLRRRCLCFRKSAVRPIRRRTHSVLNQGPMRMSREDFVFLPAAFALTADRGSTPACGVLPLFPTGQRPRRINFSICGSPQIRPQPDLCRHSLFGRMRSVQRLHRGEQKTGALYPPASSHIFSIARKLGHNVLILFHNIPSSLPQLV